jgi:Nif-specific regulatory protein
MALIHELANAFARRLELDELIPYVLERCREILHANGFSVLLLDAERNELYFPFVSEGDPEAARQLAALRIPADRGVAGAVLQSGRSELIGDVRRDPRFYGGVDEKTGTATGSLMAAPLISGENRLGVVESVRRSGEPPFSAADMELFERLAASIAIAVENAGRFGAVKAEVAAARAEVGALRRELARNDRFSDIIAVSPAMAEVFSLMESAAMSGISVLIEGDTGTGKELVAHAIHRASTRANAPFIAVNCAALPETLLESELFGRRRGAFTGAVDDQPGLFKAASGGVIFLDEIGEMPVPMQAKLLRVLQDGEVTPLGDTRPHRVDVRVLAATNRGLREAVEARSFRQDLYYRLAAFRIRLPGLRERREDIPLMCAKFLEAAGKRHQRRLNGFEPEVIELLTRADWPGNVRQLENEVERAVAVARDGETIAMRHLSPELRGATPSTNRDGIAAAPDGAGQRSVARARDTASPSSMPLLAARAAFEKRYIAEALAEHGGNVSQTAVVLGVSRVTLQKKMKEYSLR